MAWALATDLVDRFDIDVIGDLVTDDRARLSRHDIVAHEVIPVMLLDAQGAILSALQAGNRYDPDDLAGLTGASEALLKRIQCTIAMSLLFERRPEVHQELAEQITERASRWLDKLKGGENVLGLPTIVEAGTPTYGGLTSVETLNRNLLPDRMPRHFPDAGQRLPLDRG